MAETKHTPRLTHINAMSWGTIYTTMVKPDKLNNINCAALDCLMNISTYLGTFNTIECVKILDEIGIYDDDLGIFWLQVCNTNIEVLDFYVKSFRNGAISREVILKIIEIFRQT